MNHYNPQEIDRKARELWERQQVYRVTEDASRPKCYVLDMFPYPSGAGLHVGHPLGYVATDIYSRYKRMKGFNVLHPMGFDSFGLPTEQYAIENGVHPEEATVRNIANYKRQIAKIGLDYDWSREVVTSSPEYYKWTQWLFLRLFDSIYCTRDRRAYSIEVLVKHFEAHGNIDNTAYTNHKVPNFSAHEWQEMTEREQQDILMKYRLAYVDYAEVNWCEALGTVLANDEVINGLSQRGGHPVVKRRMRQWFLRISAYAERLLEQLNDIDFPHSLKEQQRNWIGRSEGARIEMKSGEYTIEVYTTRPDTIFGCTFVVLAPEHPLVSALTTDEYRDAVEEYIGQTRAKNEIDRMAEKVVSGQFTGSYATHPITHQPLPIYIADYVLMGYGTGAIMAVPAEDERDQAFAHKFALPIIEIFDKSGVESPSIGDKQGVYINSDMLNGLKYSEGIDCILKYISENKIGEKCVNYRLRDAGFSRQRYWGEPIPILWRDSIAYPLRDEDLPLKNPEVSDYLPTADGQSPNARNQDWVHEVSGYTRETDTMPAFAGSSWYFLRYMDPQNPHQLVSADREKYWGQVDLYLGGSEHAVGHLLYSRFFNNFLYDRGLVSHPEPYRKLINQGMIQGRSNFVFRSIDKPTHFVSKNLATNYPGGTTRIHVDVNLVDNDKLNIDAFRAWRQEYQEATFELEDGVYICDWEIEKMSKSKYNVVNPDTVIDKYGADTMRMYEMFLGPIEQSKPWNMEGIEGVSKFLRRFYGLYVDETGLLKVTDSTPSVDMQKTLHKTIKKLSHDIENFSINTSVSALMIALNELQAQKCTSRAILEPLCKLIAPLAPHTAECIWQILGHSGSIVLESYPEYDEQILIENEIEYPISINGKMRVKLKLAADIDEASVKSTVLANEVVIKWLEGAEPKKFIWVKGRMVNIVI